MNLDILFSYVLSWSDSAADRRARSGPRSGEQNL